MAAVVLVNYVFTYPYFELNFSITGYPLTFVVMLATAVMVSALTTQIKWQEQIRLEVEKKRHAPICCGQCPTISGRL